MRSWKTRAEILLFSVFLASPLPAISGEAARPKRAAATKGAAALPASRTPATKLVGPVEPSPNVPPDCSADPVCKQLTVRAKEFSRANQHASALDAYEGAYALHPSPWLLMNIGRLQYKLGRPHEAVTNLRRALAQTPADQADKRQRIQRFLTEAEVAAVSTVPPGTQPAASLEAQSRAPKPIYKQWPLWVALGGTVIALGATALAVGLTVPSFDPGGREVHRLSPALVLRIPLP